ncbi:DNA topoisomerase VI subunit B [Candidatus Woesearchaeota archaeon]|nr:DNA topoisomerase VI subunit B [Candidatus Woesearchaeota archaeon]
MGQQTLDLDDFGKDDGNIVDKPSAPTPKTSKNNNTKAHEMAKAQREISVAEFFEKNRHLLGFDNKKKALLTTVKEAVDNALDACEEARILPEIHVDIIEMDEEKFQIKIEDNGPGIVKKQVPMIFAKLLYGSKFHTMKQSRGQQGIGISAAALYGQLTTGKPIRITSKIEPSRPAYYCELHIDTSKNKPVLSKEQEIEWYKDHGTKIELDLEAIYQKGAQSIDEYLKETAVANPHVTIVYTNPKAEQIIFPRATEELPVEPKTIKPHPYGIELGMLIKMLQGTNAKTLQQFLTTEFSRVSVRNAKQICEEAAVLPSSNPKRLSRELAEKLMSGIKKTKLIAPPTDCISPIGEQSIEKGLKKEINAEFYTSVTRNPSVYRGNPFIIEAGIAYGGDQKAEGSINIMRLANRVPLLYQQGGCAITNTIQKTNWRPYGLQQSNSSIPQGPMAIMVHMASVWVPFTSEAKEALAHYPEIIDEIKLAIRECGRNLSSYVNKKKKVKDEFKKRSYIEKYIPHVGMALKDLLGLSNDEERRVEENLKNMLESSRGKLEDMEFDASKNVEYDEEFAKIGRDEEELEDEQESSGEDQE